MASLPTNEVCAGWLVLPQEKLPGNHCIEDQWHLRPLSGCKERFSVCDKSHL